MPQRQAVSLEESTAFILRESELIGIPALYEILRPYREAYQFWAFHLLVHFVLSHQRSTMDSPDIPEIPIPWTAINRD